MLTAAKVLSRVQAHGITLIPDGNRLRFSPAAALTPELLEELRQCKEGILSILREEHQQDMSLGAQLRATRDRLRERAQRKDSSPPGYLPPPGGGGRDPLARRGTEKGRFFKRGGAWRETWPHDFEVYRGGESLPAQRSANSTSTTSNPPEEFGGLGGKLRRIRDEKRAEKEADHE